MGHGLVWRYLYDDILGPRSGRIGFSHQMVDPDYEPGQIRCRQQQKSAMLAAKLIPPNLKQ